MRQQTETTAQWEKRVFLEKCYGELKWLGLQGLLDKLSLTLGLAMIVTDNRGRPLMQNKQLSPFCKILRGHPEGRTRCEASRQASVRAATAAAGVEKEGRAAHFDSRPGEATREEKRPAVALPLVVGGRVTGILTIAGKPKGAPFSEDETAFLTTLGTGLGLALENARLYPTLRQHYARVVGALAAALEAKDRYTQGHSLRVAQWARACALHLGLSAAEQEHAYTAGLLHDVGKIGVSDTVLAKPAPLTEDVFLRLPPEEMEALTVSGAHPDILAETIWN